MQVNSIGNNTNFGAIPNVQMRRVLLALERQGVDTANIMHLIKDNFADKFIMGNFQNELMHIGLYSKEGNYASQIKEIVCFDPKAMLRSPKLFAKWFTKRLTAMVEKQSDEQLRINKIENFFGRFPDEDSYRLSSYTKEV